jgi:Family of unknown function (DUF6090)
MIKFFRHMRQNLLMENKTARYLKYAIGEIVLVVIGILIALQVSDWNENRKKANAEQVILKDLKTELENNITGLQVTIDEHEKSHQATKTIMLFVKNPDTLDTLSNEVIRGILNIMNQNWTFNPKLGVLNSTINSGKIDMIQSKDLRNMLSSISESIIDASESTQSIERNREQIYWPLISLHNIELSEGYPFYYNTKKEFSDSRFLWWIVYMNALRQEGLDEEHELMEFLKTILETIESQIK